MSRIACVNIHATLSSKEAAAGNDLQQLEQHVRGAQKSSRTSDKLSEEPR
jgi:hypothetical protein